MISQIRTADGHVVKPGDRVFNYYDCKWGVIGKIDQHNGWFDFLHEDGTKTILNESQRINPLGLSNPLQAIDTLHHAQSLTLPGLWQS